MTAPAKLAGFAAALAIVFAGAAAAGEAIDPTGGPAAPKAHAGDRHTDVCTAPEPASPAAHGGAHAGAGQAPVVRGLAVHQDGLRVVVDDSELPRGRVAQLRFRVLDERGRTVRDFDAEHTKRLHLIIVRRDLTGFQHLHPRQDADGNWTTPVRLSQAGSYRLFADFVRSGRSFTLASDLRVDGSADLQDVPAPAATATTDGGYDVRVDAGTARPGREAALRFTVTRHGRPVHVEPYLGARGHLVALRQGDLAFLHVHPTVHDAGGKAHDDRITFAATFPTPGRYRLFLQFQHEGRVQTAAVTQEVR
jgi:hypothetical protein